MWSRAFHMRQLIRFFHCLAQVFFCCWPTNHIQIFFPSTSSVNYLALKQNLSHPCSKCPMVEQKHPAWWGKHLTHSVPVLLTTALKETSSSWAYRSIICWTLPPLLNRAVGRAGWGWPAAWLEVVPSWEDSAAPRVGDLPDNDTSGLNPRPKVNVYVAATFSFIPLSLQSQKHTSQCYQHVCWQTYFSPALASGSVVI